MPEALLASSPIPELFPPFSSTGIVQTEEHVQRYRFQVTRTTGMTGGGTGYSFRSAGGGYSRDDPARTGLSGMIQLGGCLNVLCMYV